MGESLFEKSRNPNSDIIRVFNEAFYINYHKKEQELSLLFSHYDRDLLGCRVEKLNKYYHTRLSQTKMNQIIKYLKQEGEGFERRVKDGDLKTVKNLSECGGGNWFVFATKYCSFINPESFPIYDNLIAKILEKYNSDKQFIDSESENLGKSVKNKLDYELFISVIDNFRNQYNLKCSYREIDKFLWIVGKNT